MAEYRVNLDLYNGPLDLLLFLIRRDEVDIQDIPIVSITEQYLAYVDMLQSLDPNLAGEFLVMAATLIEIKSRMLLPAEEAAEGGDDELGIDPRADLVRQLLQYKAFKDAAGDLLEAADTQAMKFARNPGRVSLGDEKETDLEEVQIWDLFDAFRGIMEAIGKPGIHPEGRFLPETYQFPKNSRDTELLQRAYAAMETELTRNWEKRDAKLPLKDEYQALILASIIEKETASADEYQKISGVFIRRLKKGMLLQTDPTVIYGLGESFDGNLRLRDLKTDTPYNTYTRRGLPPTPIAMPGKSAIYAAMHPDNSDTLYFVSRGDGTHHFSKTLAEHNRAVAKYQLHRGG